MEHQVESLLVASGRLSLNIIKESTIFKAYIQFWQTWTNLQIAYFLYQNPLIPPDLQALTYSKVMNQWTKFNHNDLSGSPSFVQNANFFENTNFWDPKGQNIIWDDRLWLGNAYVKLYQMFKVDKFLYVAIQLYQFVYEYNWKAHNFESLEWKPKTGYMNTITNSLFFVLCGRLYESTGDKKYMQSAIKMYKYLFCQPGKFLNGRSEGIFPDQVKSQGGGFYPYNQGTPLQGLLYLITYNQNNDEYIDRAIKLINSTIQFFKSKQCSQMICIQLSTGNYSQLRCSSVFRSFLFRTFVYMKRVLTPQVLSRIISKTPLFRIWIIDNAQAMCKYENLKPCRRWQVFNDDIVHQYNSFNQFYVLLAAHQLFKIQQVTVDGIAMRGNNQITIDLGNHVNVCYFFKVRVDSNTGLYVKQEPKVLKQTLYNFKDLVGQDICSQNNNTTYFGLQIQYSDAKQANFVLVHVQQNISKFGIIADQKVENIANNFISRIKVVHNEGVTYDSNTGKQVSVCHLPHNKNAAPLRLIIH